MPHERELAVWKQTCLEFIEKATTPEELNHTGEEIRSSSGMIEATDDDVKPLRAAFSKRMRAIMSVSESEKKNQKG